LHEWFKPVKRGTDLLAASIRPSGGSGAEFDGCVGAVAEGFVFGGAATAEGDAIADLVLESLGGDDGNAATQPDGAGALLRGIFYQPNGDGEFGLDGLAGLFVDGDEAAGGAVAGLLDEALACGVVVGVLNLAPDLAVGIAEARESAEAFDVGELHGGAVEDLGLRGEGFARGSFCSVEFDALVRAIAEGFILRVAAAAERVVFRCWVNLALLPMFGFALLVDADDLLGQGHGAGDAIGTVLDDGDFGNGIVRHETSGEGTPGMECIRVTGSCD